MGLTGRYDFPGIKKWGAKGLTLALSSTAWGAWLVKTPFVRTLVDAFLEQTVNWLANKGLIVLNIGAIYFEGEFDQKAFDQALDEGLRAVKTGSLTPEQMKEIDEKVRIAARKFLKFNPS